MQFSNGSRSLRVTLSIGLSNNQQDKPISFDTLLRVAEEGLMVADAGGGDRYVETELYQLYESQAQAQAEGDAHIHVPEPVQPESLAPIAPSAPLRSAEPLDPERARLLSLLEQEGSLEQAAARLADQLVEEALVDMRNERDALRKELEDTQIRQVDHSAIGSDKEQGYLTEIDQLRRRLSKVTKSLGLTEQELSRIKLLKEVDGGVSSIYREVQGLSGGDPHAEVKKDLMVRIFQANVDLQKKTG